MNKLIKVNNLSKFVKVNKGFLKSEQLQLLKNINLELKENEWLILLGKNGSGKSTLLKCLSGVLYSRKDSISINGMHPWYQRIYVTKNIGVLFGQKSMLFEDLRPIDSLKMFQSIYNLTQIQLEDMINFTQQFIDVKLLLYKSVRKLSFGERMKCEFLAIILHQPKILILDEPFIGLDSKSQEGLMDLLINYKKIYGASIILTTHQFLKVINHADRIIVVDEGEIKHNTIKKDLLNKYIYRKAMSVKLESPTADFLKHSNLTGVVIKKISKNQIILEINTLETSVRDVLSFITKNYDINDFEVTNISVEGLVDDLYESKSVIQDA